MLKKSPALLFLVLMCLGAASAQKKVAPDWPGVPYSSVKVFLYNLDNQLYGQYSRAWDKGEPNFTLEGTGTSLGPEQVKELMAVLNTDTRMLNEGLSKCYEPHHAVFFYDARNKIVAAFDVCFLCQGIKFYPSKQYKSEIKNYSEALTKKAEQQLEEIKKNFVSVGVPVFKSEKEVDVYSKKLTQSDTLIVTYDSMFYHVFNYGPYYTIDQIKSSLGSFSYKDTLVYESLEKSISEFIYQFKGPGLNMTVGCHGTSCRILTLQVETKTKNDLFFKPPFNIGMTRTEFNRIIFPATRKPVYNRTIVIHTNGEKALLVHFDEHKEADFIKIY